MKTPSPTRIPIPPRTHPIASALVPDARLASAIPYIRGGTVADVGTDHAYLPIALLAQGLCTFAVATDIHKGPATVAAEHLSAYGFDDTRAAVLLADGLNGTLEFAPRDICIFGMGGEMIVHILEEAPWVRDPSVRLILQPMTKQDKLRQYLDATGFCIIDERLIKTDRIYTLLIAEYDGIIRSRSPLQALIGTHNLLRRDELTQELISRHIEILNTACKGKRQSATADTTAEEVLLAALHDYNPEVTL